MLPAGFSLSSLKAASSASISSKRGATVSSRRSPASIGETLIAARALQGVGAAVLAPSTLALLSTNFAEGPERTRAVGYYGAVAGIGASIGLVLGGILADWLSWRVGVFINLPIGIALMLGAKRYLTETELCPGQFDLSGALSSTCGMGALVAASLAGSTVMLALALALVIVLIVQPLGAEARNIKSEAPATLTARLPSSLMQSWT